MITKDRYTFDENNSKQLNATIFGVWQIALLRLKGFDFDTMKIEIVPNPEKPNEKGFKFFDVKEEFDQVLNKYHAHESVVLDLEDYRKMFLDTKNILAGKIERTSLV